MNNKIIITATCFFLLLSFVFLSYTEKKQADINSKNVWFIYFENPKNKSLNFTIENHSNYEDFHYQVFINKELVKESNAIIATGQISNIPIFIQDASGKKITISVTVNGETKEIYKIF